MADFQSERLKGGGVVGEAMVWGTEVEAGLVENQHNVIEWPRWDFPNSLQQRWATGTFLLDPESTFSEMSEIFFFFF